MASAFARLPAAAINVAELLGFEHGRGPFVRHHQGVAAPLRRIEGAQHFTPEDHPAIVAEEIGLLLEKVRGPRRRPVMSG